jgi:uncharacterized membrane protein YdbT with pleckstrin-like domain
MSIFNLSNNSFDGQIQGEKTIMVTRKHWIFLFGPIILVFISALIIFILYFFINNFDWYEKISYIYWFLSALALLVLWNLAFLYIMIYSLNTLIITDKRLIENKQKGLFRHSTTELELDKIQDISIEIFGPAAQLLGYGSIEIQSAGAEIDNLLFYGIPDPQKVKATIMNLKINK